MNHHPSLEQGCVVIGISEPDRDGPIIKAKYPNAIFCIEWAEAPGVIDLAGAPTP
ncbi:hypothetical protein V6U90_00280 [Micromonospora sp. CPCC 206060]|uniref:hypothetical protein n=1 Tax=Micromonospora sp. CPCC 206060 TaxID=3122406 RepID=UPI002FF0C0F2